MSIFSRLFMPSSVCCTNCRTKYSLLNREAGCSNCALSFCKKCLAYRAVIPNLSDSPLTVCYECYQKLEAKKVKAARNDVHITSTPLPHPPPPLPSQNSQQNPKNWWGEGLPPPSFRSTYTNYSEGPPTVRKPMVPPAAPQYPVLEEADNEEDRRLQERMKNLKAVRSEQPESLTTEELEERLARLRGVDVEVIRNPRSWFQSDSKSERNIGNADNVGDLIKMAEERAKLEEMEEEMERREMEELENRRRKLKDDEKEDEGGVEEGNEERGKDRESMISGYSDYSTTTQEQMKDINKVLQDAESRVAESKKQEDCDAAELKKLMSMTRQKSLDAMQWNDKITKEIGGFWDRQNDKLKYEDEEDKDDEKSLDEETFKKIMKEAENSADVEEEPPAVLKKVGTQNASPPKKTDSPKKKGGFFDKFFRKDSKS